MKATIFQNGLTAYWYRDIYNFGDRFTPCLLNHFGFTPIYERPAHARLIGAGSILEHIPRDYTGTILGSGFIDKASKCAFSGANILCVRGELSRERLGAGAIHALLGDPGLLASHLIGKRQLKKWKIGIIPHHSDVNNPLMRKLVSLRPEVIRLINPMRSTLWVINQIDQCEHILSSSLHGLIVADSLGIPNAWLKAPNLVGGDFKFYDYYSSLDMENCESFEIRGGEEVGELAHMTSNKNPERVQALKDHQVNLWSQLARMDGSKDLR